MSFEEKNLYGQYIDYSEKIMAQGLHTCPYTGTIFYNIRIYSRSQVSVYRTIGPLVMFFLFLLRTLFVWTHPHSQCFEAKIRKMYPGHPTFGGLVGFNSGDITQMLLCLEM